MKSNPVFNVLNKVLVFSFYRRHAGFLFVIFYFMFGFIQGNYLIQYHLALIKSTLNSSIFFSGAILLWVLYYLRTFFFTVSQLKKTENEFLSLLFPSFSIPNLRKALFSMQLLISMPVWGYSTVMVIVALNHKLYLPMALIITFHIVMNVMLTWLYERIVFHKLLKWELKEFMFQVLNQWKKPFFLITSVYLFLEKSMMVLITKTISLTLLALSFFLFKPHSYDLRLQILFWLIALAFHSTLIFEVCTFDNFELNFSKNFPLSTYKRYGLLVLRITLLCLPEFVFLLFLLPLYIHIPELIIFILLGTGTLLSYYSLSYIPGIQLEQYLWWIAGIFLLLFLLTLYSLWIIMILLLFAFSIFVFNKRFYNRD